jgi:hypothetical protein
MPGEDRGKGSTEMNPNSFEYTADESEWVAVLSDSFILGKGVSVSIGCEAV